MRKNKNKKLRFVAGSVLFCVFTLKFLIIGLGSLAASFYYFTSVSKAEVFQKTIPSDFHYRTDTLKHLRAINLESFVGKPVKLPFYSTNPEGMPGADLDYLILFPPQFLNDKASIPMRTLFFASGASIDPESVRFAQKSQEFINSIAENNSTLLEILKNLLESNLKISVETQNFASLLAQFMNTAQAEDTLDDASLNALLASDKIANLPADLDTSDPQVKQLLTIILLLLITNQSLAESANADKQECLDSGGEWTNNECVSEEITACKDNGGIWKKLTSQCFADKEVCGNEDLECIEDTGEEDKVFGCVCKAGSCLDDNGVCVEEDNGKKELCEDSGGTWREFFGADELCLQKCGATQSACSTAFSEGSSLKGCDCSSAENDKADKWTAGSTTAAGKCLAPTGKCIAKETTDSDDDSDGVPNGQDRCPGSSPDGSGTVNKNLGSADAGCTCSQLQAMGRLQKMNQQQCPPDGCEDRYMVRYDRSQQNNPAALCQNGIITQQQQQMNNTCPVLSRVPTKECEEDAEKKKNQNKNDNLQDLLKKLMDDKKKKDQDKGKDKGQQQQQQGTGPGPGPGPSQPQQPNQNSSVQPPPGSTPPGSSPGGVGDYNAKQDGSSAHPYALHVSQFKKVCGENTYVLVTGKPGEGNFKNDGSKKANANTVNIDRITPCKECKIDQNTANRINNEISDAVNKNPGQITQESAQQINEIIKKINSGEVKGPSANQEFKKIFDLYNKGKQEAGKSQNQVPTGPVANTMRDLKNSSGNPNQSEIHFKVPKCEELAACDCCVCSCCDPKKKDCGWTIGQKCKDGKCEGKNCKENKACEEAIQKCSEDPEKSIQLDMAAGIDINKCSKSGDKAQTASQLCEKYAKATHEGICRYDCKGETKGCEEGPKECKIIVDLGKDDKGQDDLQFSRKENTARTNQPDPQARRVEFTNEDGGSVIIAKKGVNSQWVQGLGKEKGQCCKCDEKDKMSDSNPDGGDGVAGPENPQPQQPQPPTPNPDKPIDPNADWTAQPQPQQPQPGTPNVVDDMWSNQPVTGPANQISQDRINELRDNNAQFNDYLNNRFRTYPPTWGDWQDYQRYQDWQNNLPTISRWFNNLIGGNTFEYYKKVRPKTQ